MYDTMLRLVATFLELLPDFVTVMVPCIVAGYLLGKLQSKVNRRSDKRNDK